MATDLQKKWETRLSCAKKAREKWAAQFKTEIGRAYFEGEQNPGYPKDEWITVNKIYSHLQAQLPMLYSMDPYFYVKLKKSYSINPDDIAKFDAMGKTRQAMLNYLKIELKLKEKARLGIQDAHFEYGVLKVRRASDLKEHPHAGDPILDQDGNPLMDEAGKELTYPDEVPVNERYELFRIHPCDFIWDEDAGPLEDSWSWIGHHTRMTKADALKDKRFSQKAVKSAKPKSAANEQGESKQTGIIASIVDRFKPEDEDAVYIDTWEIYDLKAREMLVLAENADDLLIQPRSVPEGIERHPFSILRFTLRDKSAYPIPPVSPAIDPQKEYCLSRSRRLTHRKRFNRKYEAVVNKFEDADTEIPKLESGEDGTVLRVLALGAVNPIADAPLDQQELLELQMMNSDLVEALGTPGSARGVADADSATEASILDRRLEVREGDRLSMVVDWIIDSASKLDQLVQCHIDKDEAVRITGVQGEFWQTIREADYKDIEGEYEYSVNLGASQPRLPEIERAQWIAFLSQVVIPFPQILTLPNLMKRMAAMFHIEDDAAVEELRQLGLKMMAGVTPMPGNQGGGPSNNPVAAVMGAAMGQLGGTANGGGSPMVTQ